MRFFLRNQAVTLDVRGVTLDRRAPWQLAAFNAMQQAAEDARTEARWRINVANNVTERLRILNGEIVRAVTPGILRRQAG